MTRGSTLKYRLQVIETDQLWYAQLVTFWLLAYVAINFSFTAYACFCLSQRRFYRDTGRDALDYNNLLSEMQRRTFENLRSAHE